MTSPSDGEFGRQSQRPASRTNFVRLVLARQPPAFVRVSDEAKNAAFTETKSPGKRVESQTMKATPMPDHYRPSTRDLILCLALMRKEARKVLQALQSEHQQWRQCQRMAKKLKERGSPFDASRIASLDRDAAVHSEECRLLEADLLLCGHFLSDLAPIFDGATTLAQRCDILNVGRADRAGLTEADGLRRIVFSRGLEDSVARRRGQAKGGALHEAFFAVFEAALDSAEGNKLKASLFEPGGIFQDVPTYQRAADGTFTRLPPRLRVVPTGVPETRGFTTP